VYVFHFDDRIVSVNIPSLPGRNETQETHGAIRGSDGCLVPGSNELSADKTLQLSRHA
jgi:hypothetical protein